MTRPNRLMTAFPIPFPIFLLLVPAALPGCLRLSPLVRFVSLALRSRRLLLTLCGPWLLPLLLYYRAARKGWGGGRWLRAWGSRTALLARCWTLGILLPWTSRRRLFLPSSLRRGGRSVCSLLLKVLADDRVTRLVTIMLAAERMLLLHLAGISVSCILPLVDRKRSA